MAQSPFRGFRVTSSSVLYNPTCNPAIGETLADVAAFHVSNADPPEIRTVERELQPIHALLDLRSPNGI